jgi:hypothetical protein
MLGGSGEDSGNFAGLGEILNTLSEQKGKLALGVELREFPLSIAWVANGFGFGLWNRTFASINIRQLNAEAHVFEDIMLPIGLAFRILDMDGHTIDGGLSYKPFVRVRTSAEVGIFNLISGGEGLLDDITVPVIAGGSANLGFMYRWDAGLQAGLTFDDMFSFGKVVANLAEKEDPNSYYVPFSMNLGVAYDFKINRLLESFPDFIGITLAFDWRNFTNVFNQSDYLEHRNYLLDFGLGLQVLLFDMIKISVGLNEMLPAFGLGLDLGPIKIDMAYYGKEFGFEPGQLSTAMLEFSFSIRPGADKREWPWTKRTIVGLFTD